MTDWLERSVLLLGEERMRILAAAKVLVVGVGGVGAYAAEMGGLDLVVFTGGVGENSDDLREYVCKDMEFLGLEFDYEANKGVRGESKVLSKPNSRVKAVVAETNEELVIASDTYAIVKNL